MELQPEQFKHLMGTDPGVRGKSVDKVADVLYKNEPEFMARMEDHVRENGFLSPVGIRHNPRKNKFGIEYGHHRAAVAHRLGIPLPVRDLDEVTPDEAAETRGNHPSFDNSRNPQEQTNRYRQGERR